MPENVNPTSVAWSIGCSGFQPYTLKEFSLFLFGLRSVSSSVQVLLGFRASDIGLEKL